MSFTAGLVAGTHSARQWLDTYHTTKDRKRAEGLKEELGNAGTSNQVSESISPEEAGQAVQQIQAARDAEIQRQVDAGTDPDQAAATVGEQYAPAISEAQRKTTLQAPEYSVGRTTYGNRTAAEIAARGANFQAMSDVYAKQGQPEEAAKLAASGLALRKGQQAQADDDEIRQALAGGILSAGKALQAPPASNAAGNDQTIRGGSSIDDDLQRYIARAPQVVATYVKQGKIDEAKRYSEWVESEEGKGYAKAWLTGMRRHVVGDDVGALEAFADLYNRQLYNDGGQVKLTPLEDGKRYRIERFDNGQLVGTKEGTTAELAKHAAMAFSPQEAVKFHAQQEAARARESGVLDRQLQLEQLRQEGQEVREDHRDERLAKRLQAEADRKGANGGLTLAQQRSNAEIDAAREAVGALSPEEIRKRTTPTTATGRENPDFDPGLARAAKLAGRRKIGADDSFDSRPGQGQQSAAVDRADVAKRFRADPAMNAYRLGKEVEGGRMEVLDKQGRVIGHFE